MQLAQERRLIFRAGHLPYHPKAAEKARYLRTHQTPEEQRLWYEGLSHLDIRFLRQKPIDVFIVDFYGPAAKLVVELDGAQHYTEEGLAQDAERTRILEEDYGLQVLRFPNAAVRKDLAEVMRTILALVDPAD